MSWKLSAVDSKERIEAALVQREMTIGWDENVVLTGFEVDPDDGSIWQLDAYTEDKPTTAEKKAVAALFEAPADGTYDLRLTDLQAPPGSSSRYALQLTRE